MSLEFKIVLIGDEGVGKTSLIIRFAENRFEESANKSIGGDFIITKLTLFGAPIKLQIQDYQESDWEQVVSFYVKDNDGILLALDTSSKSKMKPYLDYWLKPIRTVDTNIPILVVGNKSDLATKINIKKTAQYVQTLGSNFLETSAKTGENVGYAFKLLTSEIVKQKAAAKKSSTGHRPDGLDPIFNRYNL
ncbi:MAG: Rab family GTPase [Candidatus Helarchaeota archaeon]